MDEMITLLGDHPPRLLLEQLFLECLPEDVRIQLVDTKLTDDRQLARKTDTLWAAREIGASTNSVQQNPPLTPEQIPLGTSF